MSVQFVEIGNPFQPQRPTDEFSAEPGLSILEAINRHKPGFVDFDQPTVITVNGIARLRAEWSEPLGDGDMVQMVALPQSGAVGDIINVVLPLTGLGLLADAVDRYIDGLVPNPKQPGSLPDADPVYSLAKGVNEVRLGEPIESLYGLLRFAPPYAARPYNAFIDNEQWQYSLFCVSHGIADVDQLYVNDTPAEDFPDLEYEVYRPGEPVTLFPDNVYTSSEVSNLELFAPNDDGYESWRSFVVSPAGTVTSKLELDLILPAGLYYSNDDGGLSQRTVRAEIQWRPIDDDDNPLGNWGSAFYLFSKTLATTTPQRYTVSINLVSARYEVRVRRTNNTEDSHRVSDALHWTGIRSFLPSVADYGDVTLLAVKARATNNLNDQSSSRFNVLACRHLPAWNKSTGAWSAPVRTRSIVWAFCDVWRANYGARLSDAHLDLDALYDLDQLYASRNEHFDHRFRSSVSCWEAAKTIVRAGRAVPVIKGSLISVMRDAVVTLPQAMFTPENIVRGSFSWDVRLQEDSDYDCVELEYTDADTWQAETVTAIMPGREGLYPESIKLLGCTDRTHAYREANYMAARREHIKETISFKTGREGFIPAFGTPIAVSHPMPRWGQAGSVSEVSGRVVELEHSIEFSGDDQHYIVFRTKDGSCSGIYEVTAGASSKQVILATDLGDELLFSTLTEAPTFMFGVADSWSRICRVISTKPSGKNQVEIVAEGYEAITHSFDDLIPPELDQDSTPVSVPDLPTVTGLTVSQQPDSLNVAQVSWQPALGAQSYRLQSSVNGTDWIDEETLTGTSYTLMVSAGHLWLRVAGINVGQGGWDDWDGEVGTQTTVPYNVTTLELQSAFTGTFCKIQWYAVVNADYYRVQVYQGATLMRSTDVSGQTYTYSIENALQDGEPSRDLTFDVVAVNDVGESTTPATLVATNPIPPALTGHSTELISEDDDTATYSFSWTPDTSVDVAGYKVWASQTSGFAPDATDLVYEGTGSSGTVVIDKVDGVIPTYYWHAAAVDVWGDEVILGVEQVL